jgi:hypothetical protein
MRLYPFLKQKRPDYSRPLLDSPALMRAWAIKRALQELMAKRLEAGRP